MSGTEEAGALPEVAGEPTPPAEPAPEAPADEARPWHGAVNPFEAIFAHFTAEIAALEARLTKSHAGETYSLTPTQPPAG